MTTTINPLMNDGPSDEGYGPTFPRSAGKGTMAVLRESGPRFPKPKKNPKKFITEAQGRKNAGPKKKLKASKKPENLRVGKKKNLGAFGEAYTQKPGNKGKGVRVAESRRAFESMRETFRKNFKRWQKSVSREAEEKAPPGWEGTVKSMKKHKDIDNPFALAWSMKNKGDTSHKEARESNSRYLASGKKKPLAQRISEGFYPEIA